MSDSQAKYSATFADSLGSLLVTHLRQPNTKANHMMDDLAVKTFNEVKAHAKLRKDVRICWQLTDAQRELLTAAYPGYAIHFDATETNPHALSAASRVLETTSIYDQLATSGETIGDIGSSYSAHFNAGRFNVHCCCPELDVRDAARNVERTARCRKTVTEKYATYNAEEKKAADAYGAPGVPILIEGSETPAVCNNTVQQCRVQTKHMMAIHSCYDIPIVEMARAMINKGADSVDGTFLFGGEILLQECGTLQPIGARYKIDRAADTIDFTFTNDSSSGYRHKLSTYLGYVTSHCFQVGRYSFFYELRDNKLGVQYFRLTRVPARPGRRSYTSRAVSLAGGSTNRVAVPVWDYLYKRVNGHDIAKRYVFIDSVLYQRALEHAIAATTSGNIKRDHMLTFLKSWNNKIYVNNMIVTTTERLSALDLNALVTHLIVMGIIVVYEQENVRERLKACHEAKRRNCLASMFALVSRYIQESFAEMFNSETLQILHAMLAEKLNYGKMYIEMTTDLAEITLEDLLKRNYSDHTNAMVRAIRTVQKYIIGVDHTKPELVEIELAGDTTEDEGDSTTAGESDTDAARDATRTKKSRRDGPRRKAKGGALSVSEETAYESAPETAASPPVSFTSAPGGVEFDTSHFDLLPECGVSSSSETRQVPVNGLSSAAGASTGPVNEFNKVIRTAADFLNNIYNFMTTMEAKLIPDDSRSLMADLYRLFRAAVMWPFGFSKCALLKAFMRGFAWRVMERWTARGWSCVLADLRWVYSGVKDFVLAQLPRVLDYARSVISKAYANVFSFNRTVDGGYEVDDVLISLDELYRGVSEKYAQLRGGVAAYVSEKTTECLDTVKDKTGRFARRQVALLTSYVAFNTVCMVRNESIRFFATIPATIYVCVETATGIVEKTTKVASKVGTLITACGSSINRMLSYMYELYLGSRSRGGAIDWHSDTLHDVWQHFLTRFESLFGPLPAALVRCAEFLRYLWLVVLGGRRITVDELRTAMEYYNVPTDITSSDSQDDSIPDPTTAGTSQSSENDDWSTTSDDDTYEPWYRTLWRTVKRGCKAVIQSVVACFVVAGLCTVVLVTTCLAILERAGLALVRRVRACLAPHRRLLRVCRNYCLNIDSCLNSTYDFLKTLLDGIQTTSRNCASAVIDLSNYAVDALNPLFTALASLYDFGVAAVTFWCPWTRPSGGWELPTSEFWKSWSLPSGCWELLPAILRFGRGTRTMLREWLAQVAALIRPLGAYFRGGRTTMPQHQVCVYDGVPRIGEASWCSLARFAGILRYFASCSRLTRRGHTALPADQFDAYLKCCAVDYSSALDDLSQPLCPACAAKVDATIHPGAESPDHLIIAPGWCVSATGWTMMLYDRVCACWRRSTAKFVLGRIWQTLRWVYNNFGLTASLLITSCAEASMYQREKIRNLYAQGLTTRGYRTQGGFAEATPAPAPGDDSPTPEPLWKSLLKCAGLIIKHAVLSRMDVVQILLTGRAPVRAPLPNHRVYEKFVRSWHEYNNSWWKETVENVKNWRVWLFVEGASVEAWYCFSYTVALCVVWAWILLNTFTGGATSSCTRCGAVLPPATEVHFNNSETAVRTMSWLRNAAVCDRVIRLFKKLGSLLISGAWALYRDVVSVSMWKTVCYWQFAFDILAQKIGPEVRRGGASAPETPLSSTTDKWFWTNLTTCRAFVQFLRSPLVRFLLVCACLHFLSEVCKKPLSSLRPLVQCVSFLYRWGLLGIFLTLLILGIIAFYAHSRDPSQTFFDVNVVHKHVENVAASMQLEDSVLAWFETFRIRREWNTICGEYFCDLMVKLPCWETTLPLVLHSDTSVTEGLGYAYYPNGDSRTVSANEPGVKVFHTTNHFMGVDGTQIVNVVGDGDCFFRAVHLSLQANGIPVETDVDKFIDLARAQMADYAKSAYQTDVSLKELTIRVKGLPIPDQLQKKLQCVSVKPESRDRVLDAEAPLWDCPHTYESPLTRCDAKLGAGESTYDPALVPGVTGGVKVPQLKLLYTMLLAVNVLPVVKGVIYVGSAPGLSIALVARLLPEVSFLLIDPRDHTHALESISNVQIIKDVVRPTAQLLIPDVDAAETVFVSDLRRVDIKHLPLAQQNTVIIEDNELTTNVALNTHAGAYVLKARFPWDSSHSRFASGTMFVQPFCGTSSTELRSVTLGDLAVSEVSHTAMERRCAFHNKHVRPCYSGACHDCTLLSSAVRAVGNRYGCLAELVAFVNEHMVTRKSPQKIKSCVVLDPTDRDDEPTDQSALPQKIKSCIVREPYELDNRSTVPSALPADVNTQAINALATTPMEMSPLVRDESWHSCRAQETPRNGSVLRPPHERPEHESAPSDVETDAMRVTTSVSSEDPEVGSVNHDVDSVRPDGITENQTTPAPVDQASSLLIITNALRTAVRAHPQFEGCFNVNNVTVMNCADMYPKVETNIADMTAVDYVAYCSARNFERLRWVDSDLRSVINHIESGTRDTSERWLTHLQHHVELAPYSIFSFRHERTFDNATPSKLFYDYGDLRAMRICEYMAYMAAGVTDLKSKLAVIAMHARSWSLQTERHLPAHPLMAAYVASDGLTILRRGRAPGHYLHMYGHVVTEERVDLAITDGCVYCQLRKDKTTGDYKIAAHEKQSAFDAKYLFLTDASRFQSGLSKLHKLCLSREMHNFEQNRTTNYRMTLVEGVPGCGKTRTILRLAKAGDLVVCATKSTSMEIRKALPQSVIVKTVDAYIMHVQSKHRRVWFDEALMCCAGELDAIGIISCCDELLIFGDRCQIGFIPRVASYQNLAFGEVEDSWFEKKVRQDVTRRCPVDVTRLLRKYYPKIQTTSLVERSLKWTVNKAAGAILHRKGMVYLVFMQDEKAIIKKQVTSKDPEAVVLTIHESEGNTYDDVTLVRTQPKTAYVYDMETHWIVGISRHTKSFHYVTAGSGAGDAFLEFLKSTRSRDLNVSIKACDVPEIETQLVGLPGSVQAAEGPISRPRGGHDSNDPEYQYLEFVDSVSRIPRLVDPLKKEFSRFFVGLHGHMYTGYRRQYEQRYIFREPPPDSTSSEIPFTGDCVSAIQEGYNYIMGRGNFYERMTDQFIVENAPEIKLDYDRGSLDLSKWHVGRTTDITFPGYHLSKLQTQAPGSRNTTQQEMVMAVSKRNLNDLDFQVPYDKRKLVQSTISDFLNKHCSVSGGYAKCREFMAEPVLFDDRVFDDWLRSVPAEKLKKLMGLQQLDLEPSSMNEYSAILKGAPKNLLSRNADSDYNLGQTITFHASEITAFFSPIFRVLMDRLMLLVDPNVYVHTRKSRSDIEAFMNHFLDPSEEYAFAELDYSKYDKSQKEACLDLEMTMYELLGLPEHYAILWRAAHQVAHITARNVGVRFKTFYQRRTGDATTLLGNTLINLLVSTHIMNASDCVCSLFMGDDVLLAYKKTTPVIPINKTLDTYVQHRFNLTVKLIERGQSYFCTMFLVPDALAGRWRAIGDPVKRIEALGKWYRPDKLTIMAETYVSYRDLMAPLAHYSVYAPLTALVRQRYHVGDDYDLTYTWWALNHVRSDLRVFTNLYELSDDERATFTTAYTTQQVVWDKTQASLRHRRDYSIINEISEDPTPLM